VGEITTLNQVEGKVCRPAHAYISSSSVMLPFSFQFYFLLSYGIRKQNTERYKKNPLKLIELLLINESLTVMYQSNIIGKDLLCDSL